MTERDHQQVQKHVYNEVNASLTVDGFLVGKVGHKVVRSLETTTVPNDTEVFDFYDGAELIYTIKTVYADDTLETLISVERTA